MNINIKSTYDQAEAVNVKINADRHRNREVEAAISGNKSIADEALKLERAKIREKIHQAVTMDVAEVKNFLFMLIGVEVKVKPDNDNSGALINRLV